MAVYKYPNSTLNDEPITSISFTTESQTNIDSMKKLVDSDLLNGDYELSVQVMVFAGQFEGKLFRYRLKPIHFQMMDDKTGFNWEDAFLTTIQNDVDIEVNK